VLFFHGIQILLETKEKRSEISWVVAFNDLRKRNIGAQKEKVHFVVYEKNCFNIEPNYRKRFYARTEKDAHAYVSQFGNYGNPFKITKEKAGTKEIILETKSNLPSLADF
jgi:hypothetical protein